VNELPDPVFVCRVMTIALFLYWSVRGWIRMGSFVKRLERIARSAGLVSLDVRRLVKSVAIRATIGDPVNALLLCVIAWLWMTPRL